MGYDMYQVKEHPQYKAAKEERQRLLSNIDARIEALKAEGADGSWLSEFEEAALTDEEKRDLTQERSREAVKKYRTEARDADKGFDFDEERRVMLKSRTRPATDEYLDAQKARDALVREPTPHDDYFRLNIFGMGRYADKMYELGMLKDTRPEREGWPKRPEGLGDDVENALDSALYDSSDRGLRITDPKAAIANGMQEASWLELYGPGGKYEAKVTEEAVDAFVAYRERVNEHLRKHDASVPGIEGIKFSTNDGWWVTKEECASAISVWEALPQTTRDATVEQLGEYWNAWISYIRDGAAGDGYTVH